MARVLLIYTGGTTGMVPEDTSNPASPLIPIQESSEIEKRLPTLKHIPGVELTISGLLDDAGRTVPALDSSDINAIHWRYMADAIENDYDAFDGFVILHGTDTMAYTASALSFMLVNLAKPVVVTGSQLPLFDPRTDAVQNLANAIHIAGWKDTGLPCVPEVSVCFADALLRGNRVRKVSSSAWQAFASPNYPHLADIGEYIRIHPEMVRPASGDAFCTSPHLESGILDIALFPNFDVGALRGILALHQVKGMVLRTFGAGNAPSDDRFVAVLAEAIADGKIIVSVTSCSEGRDEPGLYGTSTGMMDAGVATGLDMTPEAALTKLMWLIGEDPNPDEVRAQVQIDQRGEQTESVFEVIYTRADAQAYLDGSSSSVTVSARPAGNFKRDRFERAVLRVKGLHVPGAPHEARIRVFLNRPARSAPNAGHVTGPAAHFRNEGPGVRVVADVSTTVRQVVGDGRQIRVTLTVDGSEPPTFERMSLVLFGRA